MPLFAELEPLVERLAHALIAHDEAQAALGAAARRVAASPGSAAALRGLARCEMLARRAKLHAELAQKSLQRARSEQLDAQRRVPAAFRKRQPRNATRAVEIMGNPVERSAPVPAALRNRAAS